MTVHSKKSIGDFGEKKAVSYLRLHGYRILERNWRSGKYEIDVIASTLRDIAFVEVKTRTYRTTDLDTAPPPNNAVNAAQQEYTRRAAQNYLCQHPTQKQPRMDVIEIWLSQAEKNKNPKVIKIHHLKAAY